MPEDILRLGFPGPSWNRSSPLRRRRRSERVQSLGGSNCRASPVAPRFPSAAPKAKEIYDEVGKLETWGVRFG